MKKHILQTTALSLFAAVIIAVPMPSRAGDANTNAAASSGQTTAPKPQRNGSLPFHGKLTAVDTNAMTLTIGKLTLQVTSGTKISKDGKSAALSDGVVGEPVRGAYTKGVNGKLDAVTVHFGAKSTGA